MAMPTNDADWVEDVKRWYLAASGSPVSGASADDDVAVGYEAAHPALQARHWPDAAAFRSSSFGAITTDR